MTSNPDIIIPPDIIEAAQKVAVYMEANHGHYWQLAGLCDRRFAQADEAIRRFLSEQKPCPPELRREIDRHLFDLL